LESKEDLSALPSNEIEFAVRRKRLPKRFPRELAEPTAPNECWSMDFMSDALLTGQRVRSLNVIDDFNREVLAIEVDTSLPAQRVVRVLEQIADWYGYPKRIRIDNGPEFISTKLMTWAQTHQVILDFIQPGQPALRCVAKCKSASRSINDLQSSWVTDVRVYKCSQSLSCSSKKSQIE
jgi:transposase InsO family protein